MKWLLKWAFRLLLAVVVLGFVLALSKDAILKAVVERQIRVQTGLDARIGKFHLALSEPLVRIENFKIYNPDEFGGAPLVSIPELHVEYDRLALLSQKLHLKLVRFNLAEVNVVEGKDGKTNVELLQAKQKQKESATRTRRSGGQFKFTGIDTLRLTLGQVRFSSMKNPAKGQVIAMDLKDCELKNVRSTADLSGVVLAIMLKNGVNFLGTGISALTGAAPPAVKGTNGSPGPGTPKAAGGNAPPLKKQQ